MPITLIVGVLALNLFMAGLLAFMLDTSKARKEAEVRTTVANLALLLEKKCQQFGQANRPVAAGHQELPRA